MIGSKCGRCGSEDVIRFDSFGAGNSFITSNPKRILGGAIYGIITTKTIREDSSKRVI